MPPRTPKRSNIKRQTVTGEQYQRILQILIRHRSLQTPDVKIGTEVSDIYDLDDIVYVRDFPDEGTRRESPNSSESKGKIKRELHLALYFEAFVDIKENSQFKDFQVEDLYFVTNQRLSVQKNDKHKDFLTLDNINNDNLLNLNENRANKYNLNVHLVKEKMYTFLKSQYQTHLNIGLEEMTTTQLEKFEDLIIEFLTKIRIVVNYPDIKTVRDATMKEIFGDLDEDIRNILENCLTNMESGLLSKSDEFLTSNEWKSNMDRIHSSLIDKLKMIGITEHEKKTLSWKVGDLKFKNETINNMFEDLNKFLENPDCRVFQFSRSENVELTGVTVLNLLKIKNVPSDYYIYCSLECLIIDSILDYYLQGDFKLLVIVCGDSSIDHDIEEIVSEIEKVFHESEKKYIIISKNEDIFKTSQNTYNNTMHIKKYYKNGFNALDDNSKVKVLNKVITFQGKPIPLGLIFKNSRDFAEKVIDDDCLWEIVKPSPCTISNPEAFSSLGYDKDYYIDRHFINEDTKVSVNEHTMIDPSKVGKTIIVVGNSGEGKSTMLTHIANLLKNDQKDIWIVKVNLRIFFSKNKVTSFKDVTNIECATEMAIKMAFPNVPNKLEELIFKEGLRENKLKLFFLLDGINEVGSITQKKICDFVKTIKSLNSVVQCWITTQKQSEERLVKHLNVRAYALEPLSDQDQIDLLVKYWIVEYSRKSPPEYYNELELQKDAISALYRWKRCIFDGNEIAFTSVALNLKMLADILLDRDRKLDLQLSLLDLYNLFVEQKFVCYNRETSVNCNSCAKFEDLDLAKENLFVHSVRKVLQRISAETVTSQLPNDKKPNFPGKSTYDKFRDRVCGGNEEYTKILLSKIGLLTLKNDTFELSHESYVQFFFSEYVVNNLSDKTVQSFLMDHVLVKKSYQLCRGFIEKMLSNHIKYKKGEYHKRDLYKITLNGKAQTSFKKDILLKVIIEDRLLNICQFVLKRLSDANKKICFNKVTKFVLKSLKDALSPYVDQRVFDGLYESIEKNLNSVSFLEIINLLTDPKFRKNVKSYDEAMQKVQIVFGHMKVQNKLLNDPTISSN